MNKKGKCIFKRIKFLCIIILSFILILIQQASMSTNSKIFNAINLSAYKFMKEISDFMEKPLLLIKNNYQNFINDIKIYNHTHKKNNFIFWCWLQGLKDAPLLYKSNLNSIYKNCEKYKIIIIEENNLNK